MGSNAHMDPDAQIIDFSAARLRPNGQRTVERLIDGRRKGNHGNRASRAMKLATLQRLNVLLEVRGEVTAEDKRECAISAGVGLRTVDRWWEAEVKRKLEAHREPTATAEGHDDGRGRCVETCTRTSHDRGCRTGFKEADLPGWLYKFNETARLQLTPSEIAFFAQHTNIIEAIEVVRADPKSRLRHYAPSTLYAAWANVSEPVRVGAKRGAQKQRTIEATYPLSGRDVINESWSIDEYDLKVTATYKGVVVEPKALIVRERMSGIPRALLVLPRSATGRDTGLVLAAAAIGYTVPHPYDADRVVHVGGVARYLNTDQGGPFIGEDGQAAARRLGMGLNPIASHEPQANGDHEVMHQSLLRHFADGPGSRRGWTDRAGNRLDHGHLPFETVVTEANSWMNTYLDTPYAKGDREGMTRLEVYAQALDDGQVYEGHTLTVEDEAALATVVGERTYDPTRGIEWDKRYWLSRELGNRAVKGQKLLIRRGLNLDVLYAFDVHDKFVASFEPRDDADVADQHGLYQDRARRARFVKGAVESRAEHAREDAAAVWDEVADGLAEAQEAAADQAVRDINAPARTLASVNDEPTDADMGEGAVHREVVRPARRRRAPATPVDDIAALEAEEEAITLRLEAARARRRANTNPEGGHDAP